jgi:hypothetical protein
MKKNRREFLKITGMAGMVIGFSDIHAVKGMFQQQAETRNKPYNRDLAAKYGLEIPEPKEEIDPAPEWIRKADMFTGKRQVKANMIKTEDTIWKGYSIGLKDIPVDRIVRSESLYEWKKMTEQIPFSIDGEFDGSAIKGVSLISHVPHSATAFSQAHRQGFRVIPYLHFTCIHSYYADQDVFLFQHPEIVIRDANGRWVHMPMDGPDRLFRLMTCANSPSYWKLSLDYIKKVMDWGADGIFIDNVSKRQECSGPKFTKLNPEFEPYVHEHLFPDATHTYAFDRFLQTARKLVKSYGNDKVVVLNSGRGTELQKNGDSSMLESFVYSWGWEGRKPQKSWEDAKEKAKEYAAYVNAGRRMIALSYLNPAVIEVKDDAFWAFSAARLVDFIWWAALEGTGAEKLYKAHMGRGLQEFREQNDIAYRSFENGLIVLNNSQKDCKMKISLPPEFSQKKMFNLYEGNRLVKIARNQIEVNVPAQKARVYLTGIV